MRGKRIEVRFAENLPQDRTVVISFGSGIRDANGNQMAESFNMAFSTGDSIDQARIQGHLEGMNNPAGTWIWAYPLEELPDPDPRTDKAPYAVQPDLDGYFELSHIPRGEYRLFAVTEARRNRIWDADKETIAIPAEDVLAREDDLPLVNLLLGSHDLIPPSLRGIQAIHRQGMRLSFNEAINCADCAIKISSLTGADLPIIDRYQNPSDSSAVLLTTAIQREGEEYSIQIKNIRDQAGNAADSLSAKVTASALVDTVGPRLSWNDPVDGENNWNPQANLRLGFSEAVNFLDFHRSISFFDSDSAEVAGSWKSTGSCTGEFVALEPLKNDESYTVQVRGDSLRDVFGNTSPDSLMSVSFQTLNTENYGSVSGSVPDAPQGLRIITEKIADKKFKRETATGDNGEFRFPLLPADLYRLWIYQDLTEDQKYSPGSFNPFTFSEPFRVVADTIRVRPRWDTEGIELYWNPPADSVKSKGTVIIDSN